MTRRRERVDFIVTEFRQDGSQQILYATGQRHGLWLLATMSWDALWARRYRAPDRSDGFICQRCRRFSYAPERAPVCGRCRRGSE